MSFRDRAWHEIEPPIITHRALRASHEPLLSQFGSRIDPTAEPRGYSRTEYRCARWQSRNVDDATWYRLAPVCYFAKVALLYISRATVCAWVQYYVHAIQDDGNLRV